MPHVHYGALPGHERGYAAGVVRGSHACPDGQRRGSSRLLLSSHTPGECFNAGGRGGYRDGLVPELCPAVPDGPVPVVPGLPVVVPVPPGVSVRLGSFMAPLLELDPVSPGVPGRLGLFMVPLLDPVPSVVPGRRGSVMAPLLPVPPGVPGRLGSWTVPLLDPGPLLPGPPGVPGPVVPLPALPVPPAPPVWARTNVALMQRTVKARMSIFAEVRYIA